MIKRPGLLFLTLLFTFVSASVICKGQDTIKNTRPNLPHHLPPLPLVPQFPGGKDSLAAFLKRNVHYPAAAKKHHLTGTVEVDFDVDEKGNLSNFNVKTPLGYGCDKEALRVAKKMPKWKPAMKGREPMALDYHVDIIFAQPQKK